MRGPDPGSGRGGTDQRKRRREESKRVAFRVEGLGLWGVGSLGFGGLGFRVYRAYRSNAKNALALARRSVSLGTSRSQASTRCAQVLGLRV